MWGVFHNKNTTLTHTRPRHTLLFSCLAVMAFRDYHSIHSSVNQPTRPLTSTEIEQLQSNRCRILSSTTWSSVHVFQSSSPTFSTANIVNVTFGGRCVLGSFSNTTTVDVDGIALPAGIYDTTVIDSLICDDARVSHTVVLSRCVVGRGAAVVGCGLVRMKGKESRFANGQLVAVAVETGGREVMLRADMTLEDATTVAGNRSDVSTISEWEEQSTNFASRVASKMTLLSPRCVLLNCPKIEDSFVGAGALVENSSLVGSSVLSSDDAATDPHATTSIVGGCHVENSIVSCS